MGMKLFKEAHAGYATKWHDGRSRREVVLFECDVTNKEEVDLFQHILQYWATDPWGYRISPDGTAWSMATTSPQRKSFARAV